MINLINEAIMDKVKPTAQEICSINNSPTCRDYCPLAKPCWHRVDDCYTTWSARMKQAAKDLPITEDKDNE